MNKSLVKWSVCVVSNINKRHYMLGPFLHHKLYLVQMHKVTAALCPSHTVRGAALCSPSQLAASPKLTATCKQRKTFLLLHLFGTCVCIWETVVASILEHVHVSEYLLLHLFWNMCMYLSTCCCIYSGTCACIWVPVVASILEHVHVSEYLLLHLFWNMCMYLSTCCCIYSGTCACIWVPVVASILEHVHVSENLLLYLFWNMCMYLRTCCCIYILVHVL